MIGTPNIVRCCDIDYTKVAGPLTMEQISDDIHTVHAQMMQSPEELVMWEHQWDWLTKHVDNSGSNLFGRESDSRVGYKMLYGIRVSLA